MKPLLLAFGLATLISIIEAKKDGGEKQLPWKVVRFSSRLRSQVPSNIEGKPVPDDQWFPQNLDHFHPTDDRMWKQRYFVNDTFYKKGGPIFLMIGGEGEANPIWMVEGTWIDYAREMGALCFQLEHRFYGKSHPTTDMSVKNLAYLSSEQALGDLATFISGMNQARNLTGSKWIAFGGSYPGSLAAWLRLKYPHLIHGSVSTSGPLYAKADFFEYLQVVRQALKVTDPECGPALEDALQKVDVLSRHRTGWAMISKKFKYVKKGYLSKHVSGPNQILYSLCTPFDSTKKHDMANFFENLVGNFEDVVQYNKDNRAFEGVANTNVTIKTLCDIMTGKTVEAKDTTSKFFHNLDGEFRTLKAKFDRRTDTEGLEDFFKSYLSEKIVEYNVQSSTLQRLASVNQFMLKITGKPVPDDQWFPQNLDHFHPTDDRMWKQRYFVNDTFYKKGGPIFLMIGGEGEANPIWMVEGTWIDYAREMGALCFQLEHRFYGKSHPTTDMSVKNLAYLSSEQALGDLATFISGMNQARNLTGSKWIAFGGSYPGSLAAWLRLKYPHLIHGSVSTSGPLYAKADFFEYLQVVRQALKVTDPECGPALEDALQKVDVLSRHRTGWAMISKKFNEAGVGGRQWLYQTCTEFGWYQSSDQPGHPYTPYFPIEFLEKQCTDIFGSKYDLALLQKGIDQTNIMYGGKDIQVSNVIFVHGSIDPWHAMGITKDISDQTKAIFIQGTAHCANMYPESPEDPPQLKMARTKIFGMIQDWLKA
ncbi:hypothetical protein TCAL_08250 [Tigriopus californicus]|uniref:Serine protease K12H4.7 n=1 Tax=Tigriopus californicus TaxID=6832 RepID=A0A553NY09_TIGCA|nr:hypothetical protein TCAL_08250 [Tigriopus californicus]